MPMEIPAGIIHPLRQIPQIIRGIPAEVTARREAFQAGAAAVTTLRLHPAVMLRLQVLLMPNQTAAAVRPVNPNPPESPALISRNPPQNPAAPANPINQALPVLPRAAWPAAGR